MPANVVRSLFDALLGGLEDYTTDERGDVGSWIRVACVQGLTKFCELLIAHAEEIPNFEAFLPPIKYHEAIGGILRQGIQRLDNVRQEAGECFMRLLSLSPPSIENGSQWTPQGLTLLIELFGR